MTIPNWPPRDWRMMVALFLLSVAGLGAWLLARASLVAVIALSTMLGSIWPLAYYSYGALILLSLPTLGFSFVVGLQSFKFKGPGDTELDVNGANDPASASTVTTTTATTVTP